jgi:hypothetical protein
MVHGPTDDLRHLAGAWDLCDEIKSDGDVCGRDTPCRYHSHDGGNGDGESGTDDGEKLAQSGNE